MSEPDLTVLLAEGSEALTYPLAVEGDDLSLEVAGHDGDGDGQFHVRVVGDGLHLAGEAVDAAFFDAGTERERFANTTARLAQTAPGIDSEAEDLADAIQTALDEVREEIAAGKLIVADMAARRIDDETVDVTASPDGDVTVTFEGEDLDEEAFAFKRRQLTLSPQQWLSNAPPTLPETVDAAFDGDRQRWKATRRVWIEMMSVGEPPSATRKITGDVIRERGTIPGTRVSVSEFERVATEYDRLKYVWRDAEGGDHRHRHLYHHAARELSLLDEFEDLEGGEVNRRPLGVF